MIISSAFTVWTEELKGGKGQFVVNMKHQSKNWPTGSVRMENIPYFVS